MPGKGHGEKATRVKSQMTIVTPELLNKISGAALLSPRMRQNHNLHRYDQALCHRLLNAMEPGSYIRPHRHLDPEKDEGFILICGSLGIITFNNGGTIIERVLLSPSTGNRAVDIPHGVYHTAVSLESGTIFYETKAGPYLPLVDEEKAQWAPEDCDPAARSYLGRLQRLFA